MSDLARCYVCKQGYIPHKESFAKCDDCNDRENRKLIKNYRDPYFFRYKNRKAEYCNLDEDTLHKIRTYLCDNYGKEFRLKNQAFKFINKKFGLNLTSDIVEAITHNQVLKRLGMNYKHKKMLKLKVK